MSVSTDSPEYQLTNAAPFTAPLYNKQKFTALLFILNISQTNAVSKNTTN